MIYKNGLCFECQRCLYCCSSEPGYVFLSEKDIENGAKALCIGESEFVSLYCRYVDYGYYQMISLKEKSNYDCIFLTKEGCSIYKGRPTQCRTYPFWKGIIDSKESWELEARSCPGIGKGKKISKEYIESCLKENEDNVPLMLLKGQTKKF